MYIFLAVTSLMHGLPRQVTPISPFSPSINSINSQHYDGAALPTVYLCNVWGAKIENSSYIVGQIPDSRYHDLLGKMYP